MRQSRFTVEEIIRIIAESELPTSSMAGTARKYGIKEATLYRSAAQIQGFGQNQRPSASGSWKMRIGSLKRLVADKGLIILTLERGKLKKNF